MGRKVKYKTREEKLAANRNNSNNYYERNKERIKEQRMRRYWKEKND